MAHKRIVLMYITEVSGHHSATLAIERAIKMLEPHAEILNINAFNYTNPVSEMVVNRLYLNIIKKTPRIWDYLYDNLRVKKKIDMLKNAVHRLNSPKLKVLFDGFKPNVVACSQAFPCGMVTDFKKTYGIDIPLVAVVTDYIPHSYWIYDNIDYYVISSESAKTKLMNNGIPDRRIKSFGIPFDHKFNRGIDKPGVMRKLGLDENLPIILIMGGGQGLGPIKTIVRSLDKIKADFQEIIVTGVNNKLYKSLKGKLNDCRKKILLFGFVDNINELMAVSNLIITKPGGITTAEALASGLAMLIVQPIPGQEINNTDYLTSRGAAVKVDKPADIGRVTEELLKNRQRLTQMSKCARQISKPNASMDIARLLLDLSKNGAYLSL